MIGWNKYWEIDRSKRKAKILAIEQARKNEFVLKVDCKSKVKSILVVKGLDINFIKDENWFKLLVENYGFLIKIKI